ncbi:MAG: DPP IV N-terminal domain-containing protein [Ardenticatenaceae bacterium]|nr:DPP IV N-terminal domain-containing protein [Ardenticatenaceae bacterium]
MKNYPPPPQILFYSNRDNLPNYIYDIYLMEEDGKNIKRLTNDVESSIAPSWSPDYKKIAFERGDQLYVYDLETEIETQLTPDSNYRVLPYISWSHDGSKIAYTTNYYINDNSIDGSKGGLTVYDFDSGQSSEIWQTFISNDGLTILWTNDDSQIYFGHKDAYGVYVTTVDGGTKEILYDSANLNILPASMDISSDGSKIAIVNNNFELYVGELNGSDPESVFNIYGEVYLIGSIQWGPNDQYLIFNSIDYLFPSNTYPVALYPDGTGLTRFPTFRADDPFEDERIISWSGDGRKFLLQTSGFVSGGSSLADIYIVDLDEQTAVNLTADFPVAGDTATGWSRR